MGRRAFLGALSLVAAAAETPQYAMQQHHWDHIEAFGWKDASCRSLDTAPVLVYELRGARSDGSKWFVLEYMPAGLDSPAERARREQTARDGLDRFLWIG